MADVESLSHSAICVHDLREAEEFYCDVLGARLGGRVNFKTDDADQRAIGARLRHLRGLSPGTDGAAKFHAACRPRSNSAARTVFATPSASPQSRFDEIADELKRRNIPFEGPG